MGLHSCKLSQTHFLLSYNENYCYNRIKNIYILVKYIS